LNFKYKNLFSWLIGIAFFLIIVTACSPPSTEKVSRLVMFVGVDVSGSFQRSGYYDDALTFLSNYIYGHLNGLGELAGLRALFVGSIGGHSTNEPKAFHPIHDLEGKGVREIKASLQEWFPPRDTLTDFNAFFAEVAAQTKERIWTVPGEVMEGWKEQMEPGVELAKQEKFWKWVKDNVDFRVRARKF